MAQELPGEALFTYVDEANCSETDDKIVLQVARDESPATGTHIIARCVTQ